ncbi:auxin-responsive protein IAA28 [Sesamum indicum]|uniref:Auxin-responsive protein n=1 Tax=Sesamum indicum TaxID=4182 RepID=A0A6I9T5P6_SESIN|nr:auxin-responsive protein IAA28 [Sesamum indicum]
MELQLELALSSSSGRGSDPNQDCNRRRKRCFDTAFLGVMESVDSPQTLPLLIWDEKQRSNGELHEQKRIHDLAASDRNVEDDVLVGWPPVKSWRKQFGHHSRRVCATNYVNVEHGGGDGGGRGLNSMYVKVKMEGVGIGRKVDLSSHRSYQTLIAKLIAMFGKCEDNVETYKLTYQDKDGDWVLAGDVPWETFVHSAQRLKLQKNGY